MAHHAISANITSQDSVGTTTLLAGILLPTISQRSKVEHCYFLVVEREELVNSSAAPGTDTPKTGGGSKDPQTINTSQQWREGETAAREEGQRILGGR